MVATDVLLLWYVTVRPLVLLTVVLNVSPELTVALRGELVKLRVFPLLRHETFTVQDISPAQ